MTNRETIARIAVPFWRGGFELQERNEDRSWKHPPGTPNAHAYRLADAVIDAGAFQPVEIVLKLGWFKLTLSGMAHIKITEPAS